MSPKRLLANFLTFSAVGAVGTCVHYATLIGLVELELARGVVAAASGAVLGALVNYVLNYRITFRSSADHRVAMLRFGCVALLGVLVSAVLVAAAEALGVSYLVGQLTATAVVLVFGYVVNRFWTFGVPTHADR